MRSPDQIGISWEENQLLMQQLREKAALENRRQHNIFEVGDRFVIDGLFGVFYANDGNIPYLDYNKIRHATDAEIKAGKRLEVDNGS
ncbi:hypothetical protein [Acinetobacter sp. F9]|uniref:hypothetical protein n=1 Tax=Acinetobacter sp. F9 TaxID=2853158 RepID=UPI001C497A5B|nr:hypothetical protein [Acinetobacter sp. F9]